LLYKHWEANSEEVVAKKAQLILMESEKAKALALFNGQKEFYEGQAARCTEFIKNQ
jgi:hypothetical protein